MCQCGVCVCVFVCVCVLVVVREAVERAVGGCGGGSYWGHIAQE